MDSSRAPLVCLLVTLGACSGAGAGDAGADAGSTDAGPPRTRRDAAPDPGPVGRPPDDGAAGPCEAYAAAWRVFDLDDTHSTEISGLAISRRNPGVLWVHADGDNPAELVALAFDGRVLGRLSLAPPERFPPFPADPARFVFNNDWEDLSVGPCGADGEGECLWVGDFGDNDAAKQDGDPGFHYTVFRIPEPTFDPAVGFEDHAAEDWAGFPFRYPDRAHDAEALAIDPEGTVLVLSKEHEEDVSHVYRFPALPEVDARSFAPVQVLDALVTLTLTDDALDLTTGADVNRAGTRLALRTYLHVYEYELAEGLDSLSDAARRDGVVPDLVYPWESPQGEAVAYDPVRGSLLTLSENTTRGFLGRASLHEFPCAE